MPHAYVGGVEGCGADFDHDGGGGRRGVGGVPDDEGRGLGIEVGGLIGWHFGVASAMCKGRERL